MKILVIGGSYFLGRVFVMLASREHEVVVVNRGSQPLTGLAVREIRGDRHDAELWRRFGENVDVIVDFCAYREGDIQTVLENLGGSARQYIFISTVDVYEHGNGAGQGTQGLRTPSIKIPSIRTPNIRTEDSPFETVSFPGEAGEYIAGKVALERELGEVCEPRGIQTTVLRPALLYGPLNYAPRETVFIQMMARDGILPVVTGADGKFQFLYVKDGAEAVMKCLLRETAYGQAFNLCGDEIADYEMLAGVLKAVAVGMVREVPISLEEAQEKGLPLPFPTVEEESLLCSNAKSKEMLGMTYTSLEEGMGKTCRAFWEILR